MLTASANRFAYLDSSLTYRAANPAYLESWGLTAAQVIGRRVEAVLDRAFYVEEVEPRLMACLAGQVVFYEAQLPRRSLRTGWGEVCYTPWHDEQGHVVGIVVCVHDITARKQTHATIERLTRLYRTLSECNQAIIRSGDPAELFPILCRELVAHGGLNMAWIGRVDEASGRIRCLGYAGEGGAELVEGLAASPDLVGRADSPIGRAMRDDDGYWSDDLQSDPVTQTWHTLGRRLAWQRSASLPLKTCGSVSAVLSVYTVERDGLDRDARQLLAELARDISYALDHFAAVRELSDAEERWRFALEGSIWPVGPRPSATSTDCVGRTVVTSGFSGTARSWRVPRTARPCG
jgi:PAS domain S-box-containing protein